MKKGLVALFTSLVALCLVLVGCGGSPAASGQNFIGVWELDSMVNEGEEISSDDLRLMKSIGLNVFLVVEDGGNIKLNLYGEELAGTWKASNDTTATLTFSDDTTETAFDSNSTMTFANDMITLSSATDESTMTFTKTTKEAMESTLAADESVTTEESDDSASDRTPIDVRVADDDTLTLALTSMETDSDGDPNINLTATNKTDKELYLTSVANSWTVDGVAVSPVISTVIQPGETSDDFMYFDNSEVESIEKLTNVKGSFELQDSDGTVITTYEVSF